MNKSTNNQTEFKATNKAIVDILLRDTADDNLALVSKLYNLLFAHHDKKWFNDLQQELNAIVVKEALLQKADYVQVMLLKCFKTLVEYILQEGIYIEADNCLVQVKIRKGLFEVMDDGFKELNEIKYVSICYLDTYKEDDKVVGYMCAEEYHDPNDLDVLFAVIKRRINRPLIQTGYAKSIQMIYDLNKSN